MAQHLALCGMEESVRTLIGIYCAEHFAEKQLANWFAEIEFEALRPEVSCMAAAISTAHDCVGVPPALIPRLRGIMRYVHTLNSGMAAGICTLGKQYNEAGIPTMLLGSTALHLTAPNRPRRHMWQMEIGVSEEHFPQAVALAKQAGFAVEQTPYSAAARCGNTQCVLIRKGMDAAQGTWEGNGVSFLLPDGAELLVSLAQTAFQTLFGTDAKVKLVAFMMDLHCLVAAKPNWDAVAAAAKKRGLSTQVRLMLEVYHALSSSAEIGDALHLFSSEKQTARLARLLLQYRACKPNTFKRRWLSAQIRDDVSPFTALWKAVSRKITRGS